MIKIIALLVIFIPFFSCSLIFNSSMEDVGQKTSHYLIQTIPAPWQKIDKTDADIAYENREIQGLIYMNSYCGKYLNVPVEVLAKQVTFGIKKIEIQRKYPLSISNLNGVQLIFTGINNQTPLKINYIVLKSHDCIFDFSYIIPMTKYDLGVKLFEYFVHSFRIKSSTK